MEWLPVTDSSTAIVFGSVGLISQDLSASRLPIEIYAKAFKTWILHGRAFARKGARHLIVGMGAQVQLSGMQPIVGAGVLGNRRLSAEDERQEMLLSAFAELNFVVASIFTPQQNVATRKHWAKTSPWAQLDYVCTSAGKANRDPT